MAGGACGVMGQPSRGSMATIRDVASRAGVSVATVSAVMNETRFVAAETKGGVF